ncbi:MAG: prepilin-type N-terminal cleavage/methylation domain-containing protein [Candidatus Saccharibacteria bacterium]|nr:prepilin-type N-terminal cleavage/methylation domain-containing protein [Candidatus Saccharibacteria bacterium]
MQKVGLFREKQGFTLVEVLVVVAIVAIIAALLLVTYRTLTTQAINTVRYDEAKSWDKHFKLYRAAYRHYPDMPSGYYCLGTGFPNIDGDSQTDCRDLFPSIPTLEHPSATLNAELSKVGSLPKGSRVGASTDKTRLGPFVSYDQNFGVTAHIVVMQIFDGDKCYSDMVSIYDYNQQVPDHPNAIICGFVVDK